MCSSFLAWNGGVRTAGNSQATASHSQGEVTDHRNGVGPVSPVVEVRRVAINGLHPELFLRWHRNGFKKSKEVAETSPDARDRNRGVNLPPPAQCRAQHVLQRSLT